MLLVMRVLSIVPLSFKVRFFVLVQSPFRLIVSSNPHDGATTVSLSSIPIYLSHRLSSIASRLSYIDRRAQAKESRYIILMSISFPFLLHIGSSHPFA